MFRLLHLAIGTLPMLFNATSAAAATPEYPAKPIRLVMGQGVELFPRLIGQKLTDALGQQVVIDTRAGAAGMIAAETVARASPDGYTLLLSTRTYTISSLVNPHFPVNLIRDFVPVTLLVSIPFMMVINPTVPAKTVLEFIQLARAKPGTLNCASSGTGTVSHLGCEMLKVMAKIDAVHVPYKGMGLAITDLIGGQGVQMLILATQAGLPFTKSGQLRALAITGSRRSPSLPDLPTVAESGLPEFDVDSWNGIHAPAGTPMNIILRLNRALVSSLKLPDIRKQIASQGWDPIGSSPVEFSAYMQTDTARWARVIKDSGVRVD